MTNTSTYACSLLLRHSDFFLLLKKILFIYHALQATANQKSHHVLDGITFSLPIVNFSSTDQIMTKLGWDLLYYRRWTHILRLVNECIANE